MNCNVKYNSVFIDDLKEETEGLKQNCDSSYREFCEFSVRTSYYVILIRPSQSKIIYAQNENMFTPNNWEKSH